jgi:hypothetical protein
MRNVTIALSVWGGIAHFILIRFSLAIRNVQQPPADVITQATAKPAKFMLVNFVIAGFRSAKS